MQFNTTQYRVKTPFILESTLTPITLDSALANPGTRSALTQHVIPLPPRIRTLLG